MADLDPISALADLVEDEHDRLVRLWSKRMRAELNEIDLPGRDMREPLSRYLEELARLLRDRGEEALRLWPETIRSHGARRYDQHFDAEDLVREFKAFQHALLRVCARRYGGVPAALAEIIAELTCEALASVQASYARVLRTEEVRFKEAAVMESVLHHVDVGILLAENDGTLSFATPPASRILGLPMRSIVGSRASQSLMPLLTQLTARHPHSGAPFKAADLPFVRALKEKTAVRGVPMAINRPSGEEVVVEMSATPIWADEPNGEMYGVIQTVADRTDSFQKSRELERAYEELRNLQGKLLQRTRTQALGQLASGAAHALNNFLNVLRLRITLLRKEFKPSHLDALDKTVKNIGELVARLQEFSVQRQEEKLETLDVSEVVKEAVDLARSELARPDAPIELDLELGADEDVRVDRGSFREFLVNLLLAGRERMANGGKIALRTMADGVHVIIEVQDEGRAYTTEEVQRLFDPLQAKATAPQLSLLLAVARAQVQRWGGELSCQSGVDHGVTFQLRLPIAGEGATASPPRAPPTDQAAALHRHEHHVHARRVLVVDDDLDNARMLAEVLTDEGYQVEQAHSGQMALELWEQREYDAALLDAVMPELSGWDLAKELRRRTPQALIAMVTGADVRGQNRRNLANVDAVFRKPIDVNALDDFLCRNEGDRDARQ